MKIKQPALLFVLTASFGFVAPPLQAADSAPPGEPAPGAKLTARQVQR